MKVLVGTSGFAFKEWKGPFYPEDLRDDDMLRHYGTRFPTVEINNTFYRLPRESVLLEWVSQVPAGFTFSIKASQRITHYARLKEESAASPLEFLLRNCEVMGDRLGVILFQCPPNLKKDLPRLQRFCDLLPAGRRFAFEFRNGEWYSDDVIAELRGRNLALVVSDSEEFSGPMIPTADWGYARLHRFDYDDNALGTWARRIADEPWRETFVFFKHDYSPFTGPPAVAGFTDALPASARE
ncbi:MAG: DUF72 domain-containing protein [Gemmatimonadaceae bacterium]|nr:DUF72 domain-containing protein [Gemmatimonadaceae bacterium]